MITGLPIFVSPEDLEILSSYIAIKEKYMKCLACLEKVYSGAPAEVVLW